MVVGGEKQMSICMRYAEMDHTVNILLWLYAQENPCLNMKAVRWWKRVKFSHHPSSWRPKWQSRRQHKRHSIVLILNSCPCAKAEYEKCGIYSSPTVYSGLPPAGRGIWLVMHSFYMNQLSLSNWEIEKKSIVDFCGIEKLGTQFQSWQSHCFGVPSDQNSNQQPRTLDLAFERSYLCTCY